MHYSYLNKITFYDSTIIFYSCFIFTGNEVKEKIEQINAWLNAESAQIEENRAQTGKQIESHSTYLIGIFKNTIPYLFFDINSFTINYCFPYFYFKF